jgi:predicted enzyme related to lactoylglutathione lyase
MSVSESVSSAAATVTGIDICGFLARDPQAMVAFYRDKLGLEPTEVDAEGRGAEFTLPDGSTFGVWKPDDGATGGFVMFAVSDVKAMRDRCRDRGFELSEPIETPVCYMAFGQDPEGNGVIVHRRK